MTVPPQESTLAALEATSSSLTKEQSRRQVRDARRAHVSGLSMAERCVAAFHAREHVMPLLGATGPVAVYLPIDGELDPLPVIDALAARGIALALPHFVSSAKPVRFLAWKPGDPLFAGPMALRQPASDATETAPVTFLTPLPGFDVALNRLGYGAGFYDRAFERFPEARRIGFGWDCQRVAAIPRDSWDRPLHAVATETQVYS